MREEECPIRLIDADALLERMAEDEPKVSDSMGEYGAGLRDQYLIDRTAIEVAPTVGGWVSVKDRLPETYPSLFSKFHGTDRWRNAMWCEDSDTVIVAVVFPDGTGTVTTGNLHDGKWCTRISPTLNPVVTHWMPMPERPGANKP